MRGKWQYWPIKRIGGNGNIEITMPLQMTLGDHSSEFLDGVEELRRLREMFAQSPSFSALLRGPDHRFVLVNPAYQKLIGQRAVIGLPLREALPEVESQGFLKLLDEVFATGKPFIGRNMQIVLHSTDGSDGAE